MSLSKWIYGKSGLITAPDAVRTCVEQLACAQEADCQPHDGGLVQVSADTGG